ncbi:hypothetical protein D3C87_1744430 [compost metagenome]
MFVRYGPHKRLCKKLIAFLNEIRNLHHSLERLFIGALESVESRRDVLEAVFDKIHLVLSLPCLIHAFTNDHAVQTRRQPLDAFEHRNDLGVLLPCDLAGDEDAQVSDAFVE